MVRLFGNATTREYQRYREAGRYLNHKILDACLNETILARAATRLKLGRNRQLILDSEDELSVLMDFAMYEVPQGGKNCVERYAEEKGGADAIEQELLAAMLKAQTGLFRVERVLQDKQQLVLEDLINPEAALVLTDINFSRTLQNKLVIFFRPIRMAKFTMTSGVAFLFPATLAQELTTRWNRLEGSAEKYAWFFLKSKQIGYETRYV